MERRTNESPMDFEWQNGGPTDLSSPFTKLVAKSKQDQYTSQKRPYSIFDSPTKQNAPELKESSSQIFRVNNQTTGKAMPPVPAFQNNPAFMTPRKMDLGFSSGPEPASSPDNADAEDTPDGPRQDMVQFQGDDSTDKQFTVPKTTSSNPFKPFRSAIRQKGYSDLVPAKVQKHRRYRRDREETRMARFRFGGQSSDLSTRGQESTGSGSQSSGFLNTVFEFIEAHPNAPEICAKYAQFGLNLVFGVFVLGIIINAVQTIRSDVDVASQEAIAETLAEMAACAQQFVENRCEKSSRVPAMEAACNNWDRCMHRDANAVGRARVSAHTFAQIINSFVDPISWKTMAVSVFVLLGCIVVNNLTFFLIRNRPVYADHSHQMGASKQYQQQNMQSHSQYEGPFATPSSTYRTGTSVLPPPQTPSQRRINF